MAASIKNKPSAKKPAGRFNDVKFVNWSLDDQQKAQCKASWNTFEDLDAVMVSAAQANIKMTISYDDFNDAYMCSLVPKGDTHINAGHILTGRGSSPLKAAKQALYIHFQIFEGDWAAYATGGGKEEFDD